MISRAIKNTIDRVVTVAMEKNMAPLDVIKGDYIKIPDEEMEAILKWNYTPEEIAINAGYRLQLIDDLAKSRIQISDLDSCKWMLPTDVFNRNLACEVSISLSKYANKEVFIKFTKHDNHTPNAKVVGYDVDKTSRYAIIGIGSLPKYINNTGIKGKYAVHPFIFEPDTFFDLNVKCFYKSNCVLDADANHHAVEGTISYCIHCSSYEVEKYRTNSIANIQVIDTINKRTAKESIKSAFEIENDMSNKFNIDKYLNRYYGSDIVHTDSDTVPIEIKKFLKDGSTYDEDRINKNAFNKVYLPDDKPLKNLYPLFKHIENNFMFMTTPVVEFKSYDIDEAVRNIFKVISRYMKTIETKNGQTYTNKPVYIIPVCFCEDMKTESDDFKNAFIRQVADHYTYLRIYDMPMNIILVANGE